VRQLALALLLGLGGCQPDSAKGPLKSAQFGVFFGGQVQELQEIPKELDAGRQQHGFRLTFQAPLARDLPVAWELLLPVTDKALPRAALVGQATARAGLGVLDVPLAFRPADPLGSWHARVTAGSTVVIDRDFEVIAVNLAKPAASR
jgi:hypothetical protein